MLMDRPRRPRAGRAGDHAWLRAAGAGLAALALFAGLLPGGEARAGDRLAAAQALYQQGEMRAAARLARQAGGAEGLTLAARAALVDALYLAAEADRSPLLKRADGRARRPDHRACQRLCR
jgi:hypothetical protein